MPNNLNILNMNIPICHLPANWNRLDILKIIEPVTKNVYLSGYDRDIYDVTVSKRFRDHIRFDVILNCNANKETVREELMKIYEIEHVFSPSDRQVIPPYDKCGKVLWEDDIILFCVKDEIRVGRIEKIEEPTISAKAGWSRKLKIRDLVTKKLLTNHYPFKCKYLTYAKDYYLNKSCSIDFQYQDY